MGGKGSTLVELALETKHTKKNRVRSPCRTKHKSSHENRWPVGGRKKKIHKEAATDGWRESAYASPPPSETTATTAAITTIYLAYY